MTNQSYVFGWLLRQLEWEHTLAELHARARLAQEDEPVVCAPTPNTASDEIPVRARERRLRRGWSPVRGMSLRRPARRIPA
jgi:hypothetical protein